MYIKRTIEKKLLELISHFPAVALFGPRQVGKTTLSKEIMVHLPNECVYLDLENPSDLAALTHPVEFLNSVSGKTVIIDEIQRKPDLFPVLRSVIDRNRINGRFILLGSASQQLLFLSNETLAGRIVYLELTPFTYSEISHLGNFREHWQKGGFPVPFEISETSLRKEWMKSFLSAYIERDLRLLGLNTSPLKLQQLFQMISSIHGGILNISRLSNALGMSSPTAGNAISFFERSFIIRLLQPWYSNIGKRLIKSPKIYIRDSGIENHLLGISIYEEMLRHPLIGALWEGYVVEEIINTLAGEYQFYYYRTADGTECDLLIFKGNRCVAAVDTKFSPDPGRTKSMTITMQDLHPQKAFFVVPESPSPYSLAENLFVVNPWEAIEMIRSL
jgi:uncharacterized protein